MWGWGGGGWGGGVGGGGRPAREGARGALAVRYGQEGYRLLEAARAPAAPSWLRGLPAMQALRAIWVQQFYRDISPAGEKVTRREAGEHGLPPGRLLLHSPCDPAVRYSAKRGKGWHGYKVHVSETCSHPHRDDPRTGRPAVPNLITNVATTPAHGPHVSMTGPVHDLLAARDLTPGDHVTDSGYASADLLAAARARGITLIGPLPAHTSPQARDGGDASGLFPTRRDR